MKYYEILTQTKSKKVSKLIKKKKSTRFNKKTTISAKKIYNRKS